jgi:hypothetical protein
VDQPERIDSRQLDESEQDLARDRDSRFVIGPGAERQSEQAGEQGAAVLAVPLQADQLDATGEGRLDGYP